MKKGLFALSIIGVFGMLTLSSCSEEQKSSSSTEATEATEETVETKEYYCPMKCEGDKMYADEGQCPECGMDLVKD